MMVMLSAVESVSQRMERTTAGAKRTRTSEERKVARRRHRAGRRARSRMVQEAMREGARRCAWEGWRLARPLSVRDSCAFGGKYSNYTVIAPFSNLFFLTHVNIPGNKPPAAASRQIYHLSHPNRDHPRKDRILRHRNPLISIAAG